MFFVGFWYNTTIPLFHCGVKVFADRWPQPIPAEQNATDRRHGTPVMLGHQPEGVEILARQPPDWDEGFGSRSEVDRFRVEGRHRAFVERLAERVSLHHADEGVIGAAKAFNEITRSYHAVSASSQLCLGIATFLLFGSITSWTQQSRVLLRVAVHRFEAIKYGTWLR